MHKHKIKVQNNRDYAPGLAWVRYNKKLAFHHGDMIIKAPSFLLLRSTPRSIIVPIIIYVDATQKNVINPRQPQL